MKIDFDLARQIANGPSTDPRVLGEAEIVDDIVATDYESRRTRQSTFLLLNLPEDKGGLVLYSQPSTVLKPDEAADMLRDHIEDAEDDLVRGTSVCVEGSEREKERLRFACAHDADLANRGRLRALFTNAIEGARQDPVLVAKLDAARNLFQVGADEKPLLVSKAQPDRERGEPAVA